MPRIDNLRFTTDFDTFKNDASATVTLVIPGSDVVSAGVVNTYEKTEAIGSPESMLNVSVTNNVTYPDGDYFGMSGAISFNRSGTVSGSPANYTIIVMYTHTTGNNIRFLCLVRNPYDSALTLAPTSEAYTFRVRTIKTPRFS